MAELQRYRLESLNTRHAIANFTCETNELNEYIREEALFDMARNVARTFVEIDNEKPASHQPFTCNSSNCLRWRANIVSFQYRISLI